MPQQTPHRQIAEEQAASPPNKRNSQGSNKDETVVVFRIQDLPFELQSKIWGFAVSAYGVNPKDPLIWRPYLSFPKDWVASNSHNRFDRTWHSLLLTSKWVRQDVGSIVFRRIKVSAGGVWGKSPTRSTFFKLGPACLQWVQEVEIAYTVGVCFDGPRMAPETRPFTQDNMHSRGMTMAVGVIHALRKAGASLRLITFQPNAIQKHGLFSYGTRYGKKEVFSCRFGHVCADFELPLSDLSLFKNVESVSFETRGHCQQKLRQDQKEALVRRLGLEQKERDEEDSTTSTAVNPNWSSSDKIRLTPQEMEARQAGWAEAVEEMHKDMDAQWASQLRLQRPGSILATGTGLKGLDEFAGTWNERLERKASIW